MRVWVLLIFLTTPVLGQVPKPETTEAVVGSPHCETCTPPKTLSVIDQANLDSEDLTDGSEVKTRDELETYISCYATPHQDAYDKYYKKLIELAGRTFQVSYLPGESARAILKPEDYGQPSADGKIPFLVRAKPEVMKCLVLRESGWDALAHSPTGAKGLAQQTDVNVADVKCLIAGCKKPFKVDGGIEQRTVPAQPWAQVEWKAFFRRARQQFSRKEWGFLMTNPATHKACRETMENKDRDANCPVNSLAAMAVGQLAIELQMRQASPLYKDSKDQDFSPEESKQLALVQGSSHDAGIGRARASVNSSQDPGKWADALTAQSQGARRAELANYRKYLSNCLSRGNFQPMGDGKAKACMP